MIPFLQPRVLVACVGNIFLGDDGFGVEVARRLSLRALSSEVSVRDFGIRGFDLAYALMEPHDFVILVDACARGGEPGSIYIIEPETEDGSIPELEGHAMNPASVLRMVRSMGGTPPPMMIVGCEPADLGPEGDGKLGLSTVVEAAVDEAVRTVEDLIREFQSGRVGRKPSIASPAG